MTDKTQSRATVSIRGHLLAGLGAALLLVGGFGGWAATAHLAGAVVASGEITVEGNVKRVQHRDGGIVGEIRVRDGDRVAAGDLLIRLDETLMKANLGIVEAQIDELSARRMRLVAERDGAEPVVPELFLDRMDDPKAAGVIAAERALLDARADMLAAQKRQLRERIGQIGQETEGLRARIAAIDEQLSLIVHELDGIETLYAKGLVQLSRVTALKRERAEIAGERGQIVAELARAATRITETELQILELDRTRQTEVLSELREVNGRLAELAERRIAALDQLQRVDIRAPQDGIVHQLSQHTVGGVIAPGETALLIVPVQDDLVVEARILPADIDQIHPGQSATLRLTAFNQRTTPELTASVSRVAADLVRSPETGESWYTVRLTIPADQHALLEGLTLVPGMPVEVFIATGERTAMSYLLKPLTDHVARALREE